MKLAFTICDTGHFVHAGGDPERTTYMVEIDDAMLPPLVQQYLGEKSAEDLDMRIFCYKTLTITPVLKPHSEPDKETPQEKRIIEGLMRVHMGNQQQ